jgi:hypothetical protein
MFSIFLKSYIGDQLNSFKDVILTGSASAMLAKGADLADRAGATELARILRDESGAVSEGDRLEMLRAFMKAVAMGANYVLDAGGNPITVKGVAPGSEGDGLADACDDLAACCTPTVGAAAPADAPAGGLPPELIAIVAQAAFAALQSLVAKWLANRGK